MEGERGKEGRGGGRGRRREESPGWLTAAEGGSGGEPAACGPHMMTRARRPMGVNANTSARTQAAGEDETHRMSQDGSTGFSSTAKGRRSLTVSRDLGPVTPIRLPD